MAVQALADCQPEFQRPGDIVICTLIDPDGFRNQSPEVVDDPDAPPPDDITVNVAEGATVITDSGGIVLTGVGHEVNNRGTVTGEQSGVLIGGAGSVVNNEGVISTGGDGAEGIGVAGTTVISNTGEIATAGNESEGIGVLGAGLVVTSAGSIETMGDESEGIGVEGDGAFVTHSGSLRTRGDESEGIGVEGAGANVGNTGSIRTGGALSSGISMEGSGVLATNTGTIETAGRLSVGMGMDATGGELINNGSADTGGELAPGMFAVGSDNTLDNIGSIATAGGNAAGIQVGVDEIAFLPSDDNTVRNSRDIATTGAGAEGINVVGDNNAVLNAFAATVRTTGADAAGIRVAGSGMPPGGRSIDNEGSIVTEGNGAAGIRIDGDSHLIVHEGSIETKGAGAHGIRTAGDSIVFPIVRGGIATGGSGANGIDATGTRNTVGSSGAIETRGENAHGVSLALQDSSYTNAGEISTQGAGSHGIRVTGSSGLAVGNSGKISVQGADANGVTIQGENVTVTNSGEIVASGANGSAVRFENAAGGFASLQLAQGSKTTGSGIAVQGSEGNESVRVAGEVFGDIKLGGGDDEYVFTSTAQVNGDVDGEGGTNRAAAEVALDESLELVGTGFFGFSEFEKRGAGELTVRTFLGFATVEVTAGELIVGDGGQLDNTSVNVLDADFTIRDGGSVEADDLLVDEGGSFVLESTGTMSVLDVTVAEGSEAVFERAVEVEVLDIDGATVLAEDELDVVDLFVSGGGELDLEDDLDVAGDLSLSASRLDIDFGVDVDVGEQATLEEDARLVIFDGSFEADEVFVDDSLIDVGEDATLDASVMELDNNSSLFVENRADVGQLFLTESLVQIAESSTLSANFVDVGGDSEIELDGTLRTIRMDVDSGGEVCGDGRLIAPILNAEEGSRVKPGCSFGSLTVEGVFDMAGVLEIEIGAGDFDQLIVLGELNFLLGAEILFEFQDFAPMDGEFFDFLIADAITGFDSLTFGFSGLDGFGFDVALGENGLQLMVSESVPEPPMLLLLCGGLLGMALPRLLGRGTA